MSINYRIENRVLDVQLTKVLRAALLTNQLTELLNDSVKYFIYDLFYVKENQNFIKFKNLSPTKILLEKNKTYVIAVIGANGTIPYIGPYKVALRSKNSKIEIDTVIGDVLQINPGDEDCICSSLDALLMGYEVEKSEKLEDIPVINFFRWLVSKPSWTNHFPTLD